MSKPLNVAVIGCGFMGRTHSNAYCQVNHFFPREHQPVLKVCCARPEEKDKLEKFAKTWGYESMETRLAEGRRTARTSTWSTSACPTSCTTTW